MSSNAMILLRSVREHARIDLQAREARAAFTTMFCWGAYSRRRIRDSMSPISVGESQEKNGSSPMDPAESIKGGGSRARGARLFSARNHVY